MINRRASRLGLFTLACLTLAVLQSPSAQTPEFSLLIKGGHVIDPRNGVDGIMDEAIQTRATCSDVWTASLRSQ